MQIAGFLILLVAGAGFGVEAAVAQSMQSDSLIFDVRGLPLAEALSHAADVMRLDLAFAPERVHEKTSNCHTALPPRNDGGDTEAEAVLRCVLRGTDLEARRLTGRAFVITQPEQTPPSEGAHSVVHGVVRNRSTDSVLANVNVTLVGTRRGAASDRRGAYHIDRIPPGRYVLRATRVGFSPATVGPVHLTPADTLDLRVALTETTIPMEGPVVTPRLRTETIVREVAQTIPAAGYQSIGLAGVSIGLFVSVDETARHVQFSPLGNLATTDLHGVQLSGGVNAAGSAVHGVQVGGMGNLAGVSLRGVQIGGAVNAVEGILWGVQSSGSVNLAYEAAIGVQLGGAVNVAGRLGGGQFGGAVNVATEAMRGAQFTGGLNVGHDAVRGLQLAGGANLARGRIVGVQAAPLNVAGTVRGLQLGVANVARRHRGVPLGLFSYVHDVGLRYDIGIDETGRTTVMLRSGNHHVSNFLGVGIRGRGNVHRWAGIVGVGAALAPAPRVSTGLDLLSYSLVDFEGKTLATLLKFRLTAGYNVGSGFAISAGPTLNFWTGAPDENKPVPWTWASGRLAGEAYHIWPGFVVGLQFSR